MKRIEKVYAPKSGYKKSVRKLGITVWMRIAHILSFVYRVLQARGKELIRTVVVESDPRFPIPVFTEISTFEAKHTFEAKQRDTKFLRQMKVGESRIVPGPNSWLHAARRLCCMGHQADRVLEADRASTQEGRLKKYLTSWW